MKKFILFICLLVTAASGFGQLTPQSPVVNFSEKERFWMLDGQSRLLRQYYTYQNDTFSWFGNSSTDNDYFRDGNAFLFNDTMYVFFYVTSDHTFKYNYGTQRAVKIAKSAAFPYSQLRYSKEIVDINIKDINQSLAFSQLNDTIYGLQNYFATLPGFNSPVQSDTVVILNRNMNRLGFRKINKVASHLDSSFLSTSQICQDDSGYFYMGGYERPNVGSYRGVIIRSKNRGNTWDTVKTFPAIASGINKRTPEELVVFEIDGGTFDSLACLIRSDYGNKTWISKSGDGINWSTPVVAYEGCNMPRAIHLGGGLLVASSRTIAYTTPGQELWRPMPLASDTTDYNRVTGWNVYTSFAVSWNNGNTWHNREVDRERVESFGDKGYWGLQSEVGVPVQMGVDSFRFIWPSGYFQISPGYSPYSFGDLRYADFMINREQVDDIRSLGGKSVEANRFQTKVNTKQLRLYDTANDTYLLYELDSNELNITGPVDTIEYRANIKTTKNLYGDSARLNRLSVRPNGLPFSGSGASRTVEAMNDTKTEGLFLFGGNSAAEVASGSGAFRLRAYNGDFNSRTTTLYNNSYEISWGGRDNSTYRDVFNIKMNAADTFSTGSWNSKITFNKVIAQQSYIYNYVDSLNRIAFGKWITNPTLSRLFEVHGSIGLLKDSIPTNDTLTWALGINMSTGQLSKRIVTPGVASTVTGLTNAKVLVGGANGQIRQYTNFHWDSTNTRLGIGNAAPSTTLDVTGTVTGTAFDFGGTTGWTLNSNLLAPKQNGFIALNAGRILSVSNNSGSVVYMQVIQSTGNIYHGDNNNLVGCINTSDATAGNLGEYKARVVASGSAVSLTTANTANVDSITLTAGDWDVTGIAKFSLTGATTTDFKAGFSFTSATMGNDTMFIQKPFNFSGLTSTYADGLPVVRISVASSTKVYFVAQSTFTLGTVSAYGNIRARRVR